MRRLVRRTDGFRIFMEQFVDGRAAWIDRLGLERLQNQQRHDHGARPIRYLVDVERKPFWQQHDFHRHDRTLCQRITP